jgi:hypothetical protein
LQPRQQSTKPHVLACGDTDDDRLANQKIAAQVQQLRRVIIGFADHPVKVRDDITVGRKFEQIFEVLALLFQ